MKKIIIIIAVLLFTTIAGFLGGPKILEYMDHLAFVNLLEAKYTQLYEYEKSNYEYLLEPLKKKKSVMQNEVILEVIPTEVQKISGVGHIVSESLDIKIDGKEVDKGDLGLNFMSSEKINLLYPTSVAVDYSVDDQVILTDKLSLSFMGLKIKPLYIENGVASEDILKVDGDGIAFVIPIPDHLSDDMTELYKVVNHGLAYVEIINEDFFKEENYFDMIYTGGIEAYPHYEKNLKEAFESLPLEIRQIMVLTDLDVSGSDYSFVDDEYMSGINSKYSRNQTREEYLNWLLATYSSTTNEIKYNLSDYSAYVNPNINFNTQYKHFKQDNLYGKQKYGEYLNIYNMSDYQKYMNNEFKSVFYHELGHYLDQITGRMIKIDESTMEAQLKIYPYDYEYNHVNEHIAYAFQVYWEDPEFLKKHSPYMFDVVEQILDHVDYNMIEEVNDAYESYLNWDK